MKEFTEPVIELFSLITETVMDEEFAIAPISDIFVPGQDETPLG